MSTAPRHSSVKGFTLIDLLITVGIMAVIAAVLFPVFARARENARRSSCQNNLKQMGVAFAQYTKDYGSFPIAVLGGSHVKTRGTGSLAGWADALEIYTKSR